MRKPFKYIGIVPITVKETTGTGTQTTSADSETQTDTLPDSGYMITEVTDLENSSSSNTNLLILGAVAVGLFFLLKK